MAVWNRALASAVAVIALVAQSGAAAAQQAPCVSEEEVSAISIYAVPGLIGAVRLRCAGELTASGYLARRGDSLVGRYAALQTRVWPSARGGLTKILASRPGAASNLDMIAGLPDEAVRPLVDALIVQETAPRIAPADCGKIERVIEAVAPIDPEVAGTLIGTVVGLVQPERMPICRPGAR